jgi:hypothetical protein
MVACPVRLPDLTPMDYSLRSHMKFLVYVERSNNRAELINQIMDVADQIRDAQEMV